MFERSMSSLVTGYYGARVRGVDTTNPLAKVKAMAKVTSKYRVSIPKRLADQLSIAPGDDIEWSIAGEELRISRPTATALSLEEKLEMFDAATRRQAQRNRKAKTRGTPAG